jgi:hypothetical protein
MRQCDAYSSCHLAILLIYLACCLCTEEYTSYAKEATMSGSPKLLDQVRERLRFKHYSIRTEETYLLWIRRFILFHNKRHPRDMAAAEVETFLTHLAVARNVSASTQNIALNAILFLYKQVL